MVGIYLYTLARHSGISSLHLPLLPQTMLLAPTSSYPSLQLNVTVDRYVYELPARLPFRGIPGGSHSIWAEREIDVGSEVRWYQLKACLPRANAFTIAKLFSVHIHMLFTHIKHLHKSLISLLQNVDYDLNLSKCSVWTHLCSLKSMRQHVHVVRYCIQILTYFKKLVIAGKNLVWWWVAWWRHNVKMPFWIWQCNDTRGSVA